MFQSLLIFSIAHVSPDISAYQAFHAKTVGPDSDAFWAEEAKKNLTWIKDFSVVRTGGFLDPSEVKGVCVLSP